MKVRLTSQGGVAPRYCRSPVQETRGTVGRGFALGDTWWPFLDRDCGVWMIWWWDSDARAGLVSVDQLTVVGGDRRHRRPRRVHRLPDPRRLRRLAPGRPTLAGVQLCCAAARTSSPPATPAWPPPDRDRRDPPCSRGRPLDAGPPGDPSRACPHRLSQHQTGLSKPPPVNGWTHPNPTVQSIALHQHPGTVKLSKSPSRPGNQPWEIYEI